MLDRVKAIIYYKQLLAKLKEDKWIMQTCGNPDRVNFGYIIVPSWRTSEKVSSFMESRAAKDDYNFYHSEAESLISKKIGVFYHLDDAPKKMPSNAVDSDDCHLTRR